MAEVAAGIVLMLSDLATAVVGWVVAKVRGQDLFDQVLRAAEADAARPPSR